MNEFNIIAVIVFGFATWRLSNLLARERGPFDVIISMRKFIYRLTVYNNIIGKLFMTLNNGLACVWCSSVWFGFLSALVIANNFISWFVYGLAISAVAVVLEDHING